MKIKSNVKMKYIFLLLSAVAFTACSEVPREAYFSRGQPESLLDFSSEVVNIQLQDRASLDEVSSMVNKDQPTRAELYCLESDKLCRTARKTLKQFGIPYNFVHAADNRATLVYERVLARDCENRYIDNSINPYNLHHPVFGCSVAANIVQHVSDKHQFVSPALMDYPDAEKSGQAIQNYLKPSEDDNDFDGSILDKVRQSN